VLGPTTIFKTCREAMGAFDMLKNKEKITSVVTCLIVKLFEGRFLSLAKPEQNFLLSQMQVVYDTKIVFYRPKIV